MTRTTKPAPAQKPAKGGARKRPAAKAAKKPKITRRRMVWRGVSIAIQYEPAGRDLFAHLEVRVVAPEGVPLPVTETGYRSHYVYPALIGYAGGPVPYLRGWLDREAASPAYRRALDRWRQLELFDVLKS